MDEGIKISKIFNAKNELVYWYCDIIRTEKNGDSLIFHDLLVDVIVYPDGSVKVADLDELGLLLKKEEIDASFVFDALSLANKLLNIIYDGSFSAYQEIINRFDQSLPL